jgi:hypothetical protein
MTDILRAHTNFHNHLWYDCILVNAGQGKNFFARLLYIFGIFIKGNTHHLALILPFDVPIPRVEQPQIDREFKFTQVRACHRRHAVFIYVESIVRGAVLIPVHDIEFDDEFLVFDQLDEDLWMRMKTIKMAVSLNL